MLDLSALGAEARAYYNALPLSDQLALAKSNETFHSLESMREYQTRMAAHAGEVLYQTLPEPGIPSNALLDELDSE